MLLWFTNDMKNHMVNCVGEMFKKSQDYNALAYKMTKQQTQVTVYTPAILVHIVLLILTIALAKISQPVRYTSGWVNVLGAH